MRKRRSKGRNGLLGGGGGGGGGETHTMLLQEVEGSVGLTSLALVSASKSPGSCFHFNAPVLPSKA